MADELKADGPRSDAGTGVPDVISVLPLRDTVLFPQAMLPLAAGRESSVKLIEDAVRAGAAIGAFGQLDPALDQPQESDLHRVGTYTSIRKVLRQQDGSVRMAVQGLARIRLLEVVQTQPFLRARVEEGPDILPAPGDLENEALTRNATTLFRRIAELSPLLPDEIAEAVAQLTHPGRVADAIAASLPPLSNP